MKGTMYGTSKRDSARGPTHGADRPRARTTRVLAALLLASGALALVAHRELTQLDARLAQRAEIDRQRNERLSQRVREVETRRALVALIGDEILTANPDLDETRSRELARAVVAASERYPRVDPLLLASVGIVDSRGKLGKDPAAVRGFFRVEPAAARRLAKELGWNDGPSLGAGKSAELAARELDRLTDAYVDVKMRLAEYNGGPLDAGYLRAGVGRLSAKTRHYVPAVLEVYRDLASRHPSPSEARPAKALARRKSGTLDETVGG